MRYLRVDDSEKLPRAKSSHASFLKNATDHPRAPRVRDLDLR